MTQDQRRTLCAGSLFDYLEMFRPTYPKIHTWAAKVLRQSCSVRRSLFSIVEDGRLAGLAITKNASFAKLCHFSVLPSHRDQKLGKELLRAAAADMVALGAERVHVTTSEEVAEKFGGFFSRYGFTVESWERGRYNRGVDELVWVASRAALVHRLLADADTSVVIRRLTPAVENRENPLTELSALHADTGERMRHVRLEQQPVEALPVRRLASA